MKHFIVNYESEGNLVEGTLYIEARGIVDAQDKFFDWVRKLPFYGHMWKLKVEFKEIQGVIND